MCRRCIFIVIYVHINLPLITRMEHQYCSVKGIINLVHVDEIYTDTVNGPTEMN